MRIAIDLDDTLIPDKERFETRRGVHFGAPTMFLELRRLGHEVGIYTTSRRPSWWVRLLLWWAGCRPLFVVNAWSNRRIRKHGGLVGHKFPPAFCVDLIADNSERVVADGKRLGFDVFLVDATDPTWPRRFVSFVIVEALKRREVLARRLSAIDLAARVAAAEKKRETWFF